MSANVITTEDLIAFRVRLLEDIRKMMNIHRIDQEQRWLKGREVRKWLNISANTLQNLRMNGALPYTKLGGIIYYAAEDIENILKQNRSHKSLQQIQLFNAETQHQ